MKINAFCPVCQCLLKSTAIKLPETMALLANTSLIQGPIVALRIVGQNARAVGFHLTCANGPAGIQPIYTAIEQAAKQNLQNAPPSAEMAEIDFNITTQPSAGTAARSSGTVDAAQIANILQADPQVVDQVSSIGDMIYVDLTVNLDQTQALSLSCFCKHAGCCLARIVCAFPIIVCGSPDAMSWLLCAPND